MPNTTSAIVTAISGRAWVRQPDGSLTELRLGTVVPPQSEVITASGATVTLALDGAAPITIGADRSVGSSEDLATPADPGKAAVTPQAMTDSERLLASLESGDDPFGILEATAAIAGGPGGDDGGGSFVRLLRIPESDESAAPLDLVYPRPVRAEVADLLRLNGGTSSIQEQSDQGPPDQDPPDEPPVIDIDDVDGSVSPGHNSVVEASGVTVTGTATVSAAAGVASVTIDGQNVMGATSADPATWLTLPDTGKGQLLITNYDASTGVITYRYTETGGAQTHDNAQNDENVFDTFTVTVTDGAGISHSDALIIHVLDTAPTALPDTASVTEDTVLSASGNVMSGGANGGADTLGADVTVVRGVAAGTQASATGNVGVAVAGSYGSLVINADGSYTYTLDNASAAVQSLGEGVQVEDVYTYTIRDADGDESTTTLTITVHGTNDAPNISQVTNHYWEDQPLVGNALQHATDVDDSDDLSVTAFTVNGITYAAGTTAVTVLDDAGNPIGNLSFASSGAYVFTPVKNWNGSVPPISFTITDGTDTASSSMSLTVDPVNDPPESADAAGKVTEGQAYIFGIRDFAFSDPIDAQFEDGAHALKAVIIDALPDRSGGGRLLLDGVAVEAGARIHVDDLQAGKFTFQARENPNPPEIGQYAFKFRVQDDGGTDAGFGGVDGARDTSGQYTFTLTVNQFTSGDNLGNLIYGGAGDDVLIGDEGGTLAPLGSESLLGGDGNDIIFGDAINADNLPWDTPGNPAKPAGFNKVSLAALREFLDRHPDPAYADGATDANLHKYITEHHALFNVQSDTNGGHDALYGDAGNDILYGQGGNDTMSGGDGDDILHGGAGDDILYGDAGNDTLIGGVGNDTLNGGAGDDVFAWGNGDAATVSAPALDVVRDFGLGGSDPNGKDVLDLRNLLVGEENSSDLSHYLNFSYDGVNTVLKVSSTGTLLADGTGFDQMIRLENVDLMAGVTDQNQIINNLIAAGKLLVDQ